VSIIKNRNVPMHETPLRKERLWTGNYILILLCILLSFMPFMTLMTAFPVYVLEVLHRDRELAGWMNTAFLAGSIFFRPFSGKLADELDPRRFIIFSITGFMVTNWLYFLSVSVPVLMAIRLVSGVFFCLVSTSLFTLAAHAIPVSRQGEGIGYASIAANLCVVAGPFAGLSFARHGMFHGVFIYAIACVTCGLLMACIIRMPRSEVPAQKRPLRISQLFERSAIPVALFILLMGIAFGGLVTFLPVYAVELKLLRVASWFFLVFASASVVSRAFAGKIYDVYGLHYVAIPAILLFSGGLFILGFSQATPVMMGAAVLIGVGYGSLVPLFQTLVIQISPPEKKGASTATFLFSMDGGISLGSFCLGGVVGLTGYGNMYLLLGALILAGSGIYYYIWISNREKLNSLRR
jgi:MFS family permease